MNEKIHFTQSTATANNFASVCRLPVTSISVLMDVRRHFSVKQSSHRMAPEKFCLQWNDFESNISTAFRELREEKDFFDVTLACDDNQVQAHKVILSACSPFFRNVLKKNPHQHPLLYLKGVKFQELLSVLNFMYQGEVNVAQEELKSFLALAEDLKVKGLTYSNSGNKSSSSPSHRTREPPPPEQDLVPPAKKPRLNPITPKSSIRSFFYPPPAPYPHNDKIQEVVPVKSEPIEPEPAPPPQPEQPLYEADSEGVTVALDDHGDHRDAAYDDSQSMEESYDPITGQPIGRDVKREDLEGKVSEGIDDEQVVQLMISARLQRTQDEASGASLWQCLDCGHSSKSKRDCSKHIEAKHIVTSGYDCSFCGCHCPSKNALNTHVYRKHRS